MLKKIVSNNLKHLTLFQRGQYLFSRNSQVRTNKKEEVNNANKDEQLNSNIEKSSAINSPINKVYKDNMLTEQQLQAETEKRQYQLQAKHNELQRIVDQTIKLPLKLYGTKDKYENKFSYLASRIMSYYKIHPDTITDFLLKIYKSSLFALVDGNKQFMEQYWEEGMKNKILQSLSEIKQKGYTVGIVQDNNFLKELSEKCEIVDTICVRGLSMNRSQNNAPNQYRKVQQADEVGLITYTPLYLTQNNQKFIDPQQNKRVYEGYQKMVMRVLLRVRTPFRFQIKQIPIADQVYTWEHLIVVQNQMLAPSHLESRYKLQTLIEWMGKYRFGKWKVVDMDNFMRGNGLFRAHQTDWQEEVDPIFKGTVFDKSSHIDIRKF